MNYFKEREFFHEGMRHFQDLFDGKRTADAIEKNRKHYEFWDDEKEIIKNSNFFFIASSWNGYIDCNIKSGDSGFVKIIDNGTIEYPEYDGNSMYRTAGNILKNINVGLLFINFDGENRRIRINGRATIHQDNNTMKNHFGAKFVVRIKCEIYPNFPRYLPNLDNKSPSLYVPREGQGVPPAPEWKERDYIKNILPREDPHKKGENTWLPSGYEVDILPPNRNLYNVSFIISTQLIHINLWKCFLAIVDLFFTNNFLGS